MYTLLNRIHMITIYASIITLITYLLIPEAICHKDIHSCSKQLTTVTAGQVGYAPKTFTHKYLKIRVQFISPSSPDVPPAAAA